ncbi:MAG: hypothetical protein WD532_10075 [Acidimicrobiia bacterium]
MRPPLLAVAVALVVGCAPSSSPQETTTTVTTVPTTTTTTLSPAAASIAFVECLRHEGLDVEEVPLDGVGEPRYGGLAQSLDTTDAMVRAAVMECAPLLGESSVVDLAADPEVRVLVAEQLGVFAECMRAEGISDFPDPAADFSTTPFPIVPSDAPGFDAALAICDELLGSFGLTD